MYTCWSQSQLGRRWVAASWEQTILPFCLPLNPMAAPLGTTSLRFSVIWEGRLGTIPSETVCSHGGSWGIHLPGQRSRKGLSTKNWIKRNQAGLEEDIVVHLCVSAKAHVSSKCQRLAIRQRPPEKWVISASHDFSNHLNIRSLMKKTLASTVLFWF